MRGKGASLIAGVAALIVIAASGRGAGAERSSGETLYLANCSNCHGVVGHSRLDSPPGPRIVEDRIGLAAMVPREPIQLAVALPHGPTLTGVIGREAGTIAGFEYSRGFLSALRGVTWTRRTLDRWITDTRAWAPDAIMVYRQPDPQVRARIIDYLENPLPSSARLNQVPMGGGDTGLPRRTISSAVRRQSTGHP